MIFRCVLEIVAVFIVLPILVFLCVKFAVIGFFKGIEWAKKQIDNNENEKGANNGNN